LDSIHPFKIIDESNPSIHLKLWINPIRTHAWLKSRCMS